MLLTATSVTNMRVIQKRYYYANITFIDEQIGRVIKALKEKKVCMIMP